MRLTRRTFLQAVALSPVAAYGQIQKPEAPLAIPAKAVTTGPKHHWFGYYDKFPWDKTGRYLLCNEVDFCDRQPKPGETITVGMVDLKDNNRFIPLDTTAAWSWQQGTMLQWCGLDSADLVIYNAVQDKQFVGVLRSISKKKTVTVPRPIYTITADGTKALSLDFARLHRLRPGYGYASVPETHAGDPAPKDVGIWLINMLTNDADFLIGLEQLAKFQPDGRFTGAEHWVNHLQFNPSGTRFGFLHRWRKGTGGWQTRLFSACTDGSDLKLMLDTGYFSHYDWRDDSTILGWMQPHKGEPRKAFALLNVDGRPPEVVFENEKQDGHCSYSPDRKWVLNDTYPDKERFQRLMLLNVKTGRRHDLNKFLSPKTFTGAFRCDLHPRWNRDGTQVCFDGCHEPQRQVYIVDVADIVKS